MIPTQQSPRFTVENRSEAWRAHGGEGRVWGSASGVRTFEGWSGHEEIDNARARL